MSVSKKYVFDVVSLLIVRAEYLNVRNGLIVFEGDALIMDFVGVKLVLNVHSVFVES